MSLGLLMVLGGLAGCGGGGDDFTPAEQQAVPIKGKLQGGSAVGLKNAMVTVGSISTLTMADGSFQLSTPASAGAAVVLVKKSGFGTTAKTALLRAGSVTDLTTQLYADQVISSFSAISGVTVNPSGATVKATDLAIPSYVDSAGAKPLSKPMMEWFAKHALGKPVDAKDPRIDLVNANPKGLPPITLINAQIDPLRSDSGLLEAALRRAGMKVELKVYAGTTHEFFGMAAGAADAKDAHKLVGQQLKAALK